MKQASHSACSVLVLLLSGTILWFGPALSPAPSPAGWTHTLSRAGFAGRSPAIPMAIRETIQDFRHASDDWDCPDTHGTLGHLPLWTCSHPLHVTADTSSGPSALPENTRFPETLPARQNAAGVANTSSDYHPLPYRPPARLL